MAFGGLNGGGGSNQPTAEINMVPLIDVMLVLLVIFMITAPLLSHSIVIDLPQVSSQQVKEDPVVVDVAIDARGTVFWNEEPVSMDGLASRMRDAAHQQPQPDLRLRADRATRYDVLAEVMGHANRAGIKGIGFVTTPSSSNGADSTSARAATPPSPEPAS